METNLPMLPLDAQPPKNHSSRDLILRATTPTFNGKVESWIQPRTASYALVAQAKEYVRDMMAAKPPADLQNQIKPRVASFMCHYFVALSDARLNAMVAHDWLDSLKDMPYEAICKAVTHWRDNMTKKPTPAEIRALCIEFYPADEWKRLQRAKQIAAMTPSDKAQPAENTPWTPPTEEQKAAVAKLVANAIKGMGSPIITKEKLPHDRA